MAAAAGVSRVTSKLQLSPAASVAPEIARLLEPLIVEPAPQKPLAGRLVAASPDSMAFRSSVKAILVAASSRLVFCREKLRVTACDRPTWVSEKLLEKLIGLEAAASTTRVPVPMTLLLEKLEKVENRVLLVTWSPRLRATTSTVIVQLAPAVRVKLSTSILSPPEVATREPPQLLTIEAGVVSASPLGRVSSKLDPMILNAPALLSMV